MIRWIRLSSCLCIGAMLVFVALAGCNKKDPGKSPEAKTTAPAEHDHGDTGPHGGPLADWEDKFHGEFTVDHSKSQVVVYILDDKAKAAPKIDVAKITEVKVTVANTKPGIVIDLKHDPKLSDEKGIAFVGTHKLFAKPAERILNISADIDGKHYSNDITYKPSKTAQLYLTPGGIYTLADIKANGSTTPAEKFKGKTWAHAEDLKPGDKICPVTKNKSEAGCSWVVNAQRYEFCCPPCVDKFVGWAHNQPEKIKNANEYVVKGS